MNRQSSNSVKMLKIAASATKQTTKLITRERNSVASSRFGKANVLLKRTVVSMDLFGSGDDLLVILGRLCGSTGIRWTSMKSRLKPTRNAVASHGPTYGDIVPARANDSPSSDSR